MVTRIELGEVVLDVVRKDIKNVHLSVHPPSGAVTMSAPRRYTEETLRVFAVSKLSWIKEQQRKMRAQERETPRELLNRESHYVWGRRYLLTVRESDGPPAIDLSASKMILTVRPETNFAKREEILDAWYRKELRTSLSPIIAKWEPILGVTVARTFVQRMKTKWGSCTPTTRSIRLNSELAKKPHECLEYVAVHEMVHLLEPTHNQRFVALMDLFLPNWQSARETLNRLPVRHASWGY